MGRAKKNRMLADKLINTQRRKPLDQQPQFVQQHVRNTEGGPEVPLRVGSHQFRLFSGLDYNFGCYREDYPPETIIPEGFFQHSNPHRNVAASIFYSGGSLDAFGLDYLPGINRLQIKCLVGGLLKNMDVSHERKMATVAWCLSHLTTVINKDRFFNKADHVPVSDAS